MKQHLTIRNYSTKIITALTVCVMLFLSSCMNSIEENNNPNIIFILDDDIEMIVY